MVWLKLHFFVLLFMRDTLYIHSIFVKVKKKLVIVDIEKLIFTMGFPIEWFSNIGI